MIPVLLFDDLAADLGPLSDLRASYEQRTGALTAVERWLRHRRLGGVVASAATSELRAARMATCGAAINPAVSEAILVNGRADLTPRQVDGLALGARLSAPDGSLAATRLSGDALKTWMRSANAGGPVGAAGATGVGAPSAVPVATTVSASAPIRVWSRPWHLLDAEALAARMTDDFALIVGDWSTSDHGSVPSWATKAGNGHAHVHASAKVGAGVVLDTTAGPILLDEGCDVRHGAILIGPVYVGPGVVVAERAHVKARTVLGPHSRAGGEVGSCIFQGYGNKVHDGHLGDALIGEWVNLGAGTVNSNLLNTYSEVAMRLRPGAPLERTGRQFMGCIVGDHTKVAIGTRIMTGASIGTATMWAASAPIAGAVGSFQWVTDDGRRMYQVEKFIQLARTVMARRHVTLPPGEEVALRALLAGAGSVGTGA